MRVGLRVTGVLETGAAVGTAVGAAVGIADVLMIGVKVVPGFTGACETGTEEGALVNGTKVGVLVGFSVGYLVGLRVGAIMGFELVCGADVDNGTLVAGVLLGALAAQKVSPV